MVALPLPLPLLLLLLAAAAGSQATVYDLERDFGAVPYTAARPETAHNKTAWANGAAFNVSFNKLQPGDTLVVPNKTFHLVGGIIVHNMRDVVIRLEGTLVYAFEDTVAAAEEYIKDWPRRTKGAKGKEGAVLECMHFYNISNVTFTSSGMGTLDGRGQKWWGIPGLGYLKREENRPRMINIEGGSRDIVFANILLEQAPYWTFNADVR
eukprot:SAG22_NODE_987_length_6142_cov_3.152242_4_plen_209_part_00